MSQAKTPTPVSDPHPENEEDFRRHARPGGARPPRDMTQKVNPATHSGKAPEKPQYRGRGKPGG